MEPLSQYDALIFDIDGTLWNASPASAKGWTRGLEKLGIDRTISAEQIERVAGHPYAQCVDILLPELRVQYPTLLNTLNDCETEVVTAEGGKFYDGVIDGLLHLARSYKVFLVSNCQEWYLNLFLDFSGFRAMLAGVDCHGLSGLPKHDMLVRIKREHALRNAVYIGDTAGDEAAAKLANLAFVYVSWGFGTPEGKPRTVNSFAELLTYVTVADTR